MEHFPRRRFLHLAAGAAALPAVSVIARAQTYPSRPITMIVAFAAGGATDVIGRLLAERMRTSLGQPVIIENVSGANGSIGTRRSAFARPDGYTINLGTMAAYVLNAVYYSLPYDVLNDFAPISPVAKDSFFLFGRTKMPTKDLRELITWLTTNPDKASAGIASVALQLVTVFFPERNRDAFCARAISWRRPRNPGPCRPANRPAVWSTGPATIDAGWHHKGLCGDR
jgi:tripartite-type tricarboxylate transporter receptor subunit TctC